MQCRRPGHIGIAGVNELIKIIAQWWDVANGAVWPFGVVPEEVTHQVVIEEVRLIN